MWCLICRKLEEPELGEPKLGEPKDGDLKPATKEEQEPAGIPIIPIDDGHLKPAAIDTGSLRWKESIQNPFFGSSESINDGGSPIERTTESTTNATTNVLSLLPEEEKTSLKKDPRAKPKLKNEQRLYLE